MNQILLALLIAACYQVSSPPYRMLWKSQVDPLPHLRIQSYAVRVESYLDTEECKQLVCCLIKEQKPTKHGMLQIHIYHKLDEYLPDIGLPEVKRLQVERHIASYLWNEEFSKESGRGHFLIRRDKRGIYLKNGETVRFDHEIDCGPLAIGGSDQDNSICSLQISLF
jgi:hypothetical protein